MKYTPEHVSDAEARIKDAREKLLATVAEVQARLRPSALAQDAVESAVQGFATVARRGTRAVRKRPLALAAFAGTIGLVMARRWIGDIARGSARPDATTADADSLKPKRRTRKTKEA